jgi:hypothetical protein
MIRETIFSVFWNAPDDIIAMTHGGEVPMEAFPKGIPSLAENGIANQLILASKARNDAGDAIGIFTEVEVFSKGDPFEVYSTLVLPGQGALVSYQTKSRSTLMEPFSRVLASGERWSGEMEVGMTTGPAPDGRGTIIAASGQFAGMTGFHQQSMTFYTITQTGSAGRARERFFLTRSG